ncbi:MAG: NYN domain-containing protein [Salinibacter sp.]|uniref:NYN domain-containing protein n=1 Tax=Salinibacter sp. TaxID=2065818 RepID=UPI0035D45CEE
MIQTNAQNTAQAKRAAMFIDYDNLHRILKSQSGPDNSPDEFAIEIFDEVSRYLEEGDDAPTVFARAYGRFGMLPDNSQAPSVLHRRGIEPVHVPAAMQDNTAEIRLTMDLTQFLVERPGIQTLVIVTGNRPYLPLVRRIREQGRRPLVAAVNPPQTSDTPAFAEDNQYLDARNLLSQDFREALLANAPESGAAYTQAKDSSNPPPQKYKSLTNPVARRAIEITEEHFGQYDEVYLTPLLRKLSDILGSDHDPKSLVSELEAAGAARLEKRNGYPYNYTVLIVNDDHPDVQDVHDEQASSSAASTTATETNGSYDTADAPTDDAPADEALASSVSPTEEAPAEDDVSPESLDADSESTS